MSLPPKVVPKQAAVAVSGPGSGPSPSSQLRATLTSVSLPPGAPTAPQPGAVPPPQIPRVQPSLDDRIFPTQPGVAVYSVPRHAGALTAYDITKGHPSLAGTRPVMPTPGASQSTSAVSIGFFLSFLLLILKEDLGPSSITQYAQGTLSSILYSPRSGTSILVQGQEYPAPYHLGTTSTLSHPLSLPCSYSWPTLLPRTVPLNPYHSAYTTATPPAKLEKKI
ncbi:eukaryotic translation initiation factor 4 gamma 3 [Lates japonicus]|uniref:Eukaryotic translation initiation factor 4 gamma 3 n=1 Tax=Lates japonicus TaxID=270547 RepID=A0AAD3RL18_LATJO|nr:eukaryotic translation initiation factor 4 gamma 3 [Lates japonicus]